MADVMQALFRSLKTLIHPRVWLLIAGPALASLLASIVLAVFLLDRLIAGLLEQPLMSWLTAWGALWLAKVIATLGGWMVILAASYLLAMLLAAIFVLPLLLNQVAATDYPDLARQGKDSLIAGSWNSIAAALLFIVSWIITLPLWLVPGLGLILPLILMAFLNRRTFAFDALAAHATDDEWRAVLRTQATPLLLLGLVMGVLTHVPIVGLLVPAIAALAYIHFCLEALRRMRRGTSARPSA